MHRLPQETLYYEFSRHPQPRISIRSGDLIEVETEDAFSGQIRKDSDRRDKTTRPIGNPQTGPIEVLGALPGDALAITIESIQPTIGQCSTRTGDAAMLSQWLGSDCPHGVHVCPIRDGKIFWSDDLTIPYKPMLGCMGTAPQFGAPTTLLAGSFGGNMDLVEACPGNTVILPVFVPGAWLYVGDAHAAMGHGELSASGLEMPATSRLKVEVLPQKKITHPRIEGPDFIMAIATGNPMERSFAEASARLILWMEEEYGWDRWRAYDLLTHVATSSVGYYAYGTVGVKVEKKYLQGR